MIPVAKTDNLLIQEVGDELIAYDKEKRICHCLTPLAVSVLRHCNGENTVEDIARLLKPTLKQYYDTETNIKEVVYLCLDELDRYDLIEGYSLMSANSSNLSRRKVMKAATVAGGVAVGAMFPVVKSMVAPEPAAASSNFDRDWSRREERQARREARREDREARREDREARREDREARRGNN